MKYDVHLYYTVRLTAGTFEASSQEEAIKLATDSVALHEYLGAPVFDDESPYLGALVDEHGDDEYLHTCYHQGPGALNYLKEKS